MIKYRKLLFQCVMDGRIRVKQHMHPVNKTNGRTWFLAGGFLEFQAAHPSLCDSKTSTGGDGSSTGSKVPPLTSMSQPCMPVANVGPTKILPYLYLGSQKDALSMETVQVGQRSFSICRLNVTQSRSFPGHLFYHVRF